MLTRLKVAGFKKLVGVDVRFGPFTCIAGANGVGKSNLFDAIRFLSLTANYSLLEAALRVRDEAGHNTDVRGLFHRTGDKVADTISFDAEMIVPAEAVDDLGQTGRASITFLRYTLVVRLRQDAANGPTSNPLEIVHEELVHILKGSAHEHLLFPHNVREWRSRVVIGRRAGVAFISTAEKEGGGRIIKLHQDGKGGGRAYERTAMVLPRTVLSSSTAAESPTALCGRREMQSWRLLQLEPAALRQPDEFTATAHLDSNGLHLPANLNRLAMRGEAAQVYSHLTNRLSELIGSVRSIRIDRDEKRELLTLMMTGHEGTELPARALSDGTLRFLALLVLELDPETPGLICLEEPENAIHPDRIPAMLQLLQDIATDPEEPADETNSLRQVIVNTHSPSVVMAVPEDSVLLAKPEPDLRDGKGFTKVVFACLPGTWRAKGDPPCPKMGIGDMLSYLKPAAVIRLRERPAKSRRRVIDHPELAFAAPSQDSVKPLRHTLISDGPRDANLIPIINWTLKERGNAPLANGVRAEFWRLEKPPQPLAERIRKAIELFPCEVLFIHRDAEREPPEHRHAEIQAAVLGAEAKGCQVPAVAIVPVRMLEAWLLFDERTLANAARRRVSVALNMDVHAPRPQLLGSPTLELHPRGFQPPTRPSGPAARQRPSCCAETVTKPAKLSS